MAACAQFDRLQRHARMDTAGSMEPFFASPRAQQCVQLGLRFFYQDFDMLRSAIVNLNLAKGSGYHAPPTHSPSGASRARPLSRAGLLTFFSGVKGAAMAHEG